VTAAALATVKAPAADGKGAKDQAAAKGKKGGKQ